MKRFTRWFPLVIIAAGILAYANSFSGPFVLDDARVITGNPNIHTLWPPWKAIYVPTRWVADLTFALNLAMGGFTPADFKMTNILIHCLAALFLYGVVRRTLRLPVFWNQFESSAASLALATALLWIAHPLQTSCVTYVAQRIEALMGLFYLATTYCFARSFTSPHPRRWTNAAIIFCALGMGTKEVMVTAPVLLFIYDGLVASSWTEALRLRWKTHLALFLTIGIFAFLFLMGVSIAIGQNVNLLEHRISPWNYLLTQTEVIFHYLRLTFVPTSLCLYYRWPISRGLADAWPAACAIGALGLITLIGLFRRKTFAFPLLWFFVILAPTSSILPLPDAAFEHRMYLPLAGILSLVVIGVHALWRKWTNPQARTWQSILLPALTIITTVWFASLTHLRNNDYQSDETMWRDVATKRPENYRAQLALAGIWVSHERNDEAIALLTNMLARLPDYSQQPFESIQKQWKEDSSIPCVDYALARSLLGSAMLNVGQTNTAVTHFKEAMRVTPSHPTPYMSIARISLAQRHHQEAIMWMRKAYERSPADQNILGILASLYAIQKNWPQAIKFYGDLLKLNPTHGFARAQLAWILATCPSPSLRDGKQAVTLALPLITMSEGASPRAYDIVAAAYAECGEFDKAVRYADEALRLLATRTHHDPSEENASPDKSTQALSRDAIIKRVELYHQGQSYQTAP